MRTQPRPSSMCSGVCLSSGQMEKHLQIVRNLGILARICGLETEVTLRATSEEMNCVLEDK